MAKKTVEKDFSEENLDDLLGDIPPPKKSARKSGKIVQPPPGSEQSVPASKTFKEIMAEQKDDKLPSEKKTEDKPPKEPRKVKGEMVTFKNKKGEIITGMGQLYWCVRMDGKLHYKEFSAAEVLDPDFTL